MSARMTRKFAKRKVHSHLQCRSRRTSNMSAVYSSAPAKVILFGEHLVVHGATALSTALDLRTFVRLQPVTGATEPSVHIVLPDIKVDVTIPFASLKYPGELCAWNDPERMANEKLLEFLETPANGNKGVVAALFLIVSIAGAKLVEKGSFEVFVLSEFQPGVGLGSSGAFNVAMSAALLRFYGHLDSSSDVAVDNVQGSARGWQDVLKPTHDNCTLVSRWAYAAETIMHGRPSGIDNSISTFGGAVAFQSGNISVIPNVPALKFAITNTKVPRSTKILVSNVGELRKLVPAVFDPLIASVEQISQTALRIFADYVKAGDANEETKKNLEKELEALIDVNQGILNAIGVGHNALDLVVKISRCYNFHAKLTGAGGGGCAITFLNSDTHEENPDALRADLFEAGFDCFDAKIGAAGVLYHSNLPSIFEKK